MKKLIKHFKNNPISYLVLLFVGIFLWASIVQNSLFMLIFSILILIVLITGSIISEK